MQIKSRQCASDAKTNMKHNGGFWTLKEADASNWAVLSVFEVDLIRG